MTTLTAGVLHLTAEAAATRRAARISIRDLHNMTVGAAKHLLPNVNWSHVEDAADAALYELSCNLLEDGWHDYGRVRKTIAHWLVDASMGEIAARLRTTATRCDVADMAVAA